MAGILNQRVLKRVGSTITDLSVELSDFRSGAVALPTATTDAIYIGTVLPFNHKWIEIDTGNGNASVIDVDIWWSNQWEPSVDIIDRTSAAGLTLAGSEILQWNTNDEKGWDNEDDSIDIDGLENGPLIYNMYWVRLTWNNTLTAPTVSYVGQKFSNDSELYSRYPDLNNAQTKLRFAAGKVDWDEQSFMSAEDIQTDLRQRNLTLTRDQIVDFDLFRNASIHKTAEIIYSGLQGGFEDQMKRARQGYVDAMNMGKFNIDKNRDGSLNVKERSRTARIVRR